MRGEDPNRLESPRIHALGDANCPSDRVEARNKCMRVLVVHAGKEEADTIDALICSIPQLVSCHHLSVAIRPKLERRTLRFLTLHNISWMYCGFERYVVVMNDAQAHTQEVQLMAMALTIDVDCISD